MTTKKTAVEATGADGLAPDVEVPKLIPALMPGDLFIPVIAKYIGYEIKNSKRFGRDQKLYQFQLPQDFGGGLKFSLWSQTQLDLKLGQIPRGGIVMLQYHGKEDGERSQHNWTVRPFRGTSAQLQDLISRHAEGCEIAQHATEMLSQSMSGGMGSNDDDDQLPF